MLVMRARWGSLLTRLVPLQTDKEQLTAEAKELRQKVKHLQDQLSPLTRQREYQEKEIQRLNKVRVQLFWVGGSLRCLHHAPLVAAPTHRGDPCSPLPIPSCKRPLCHLPPPSAYPCGGIWARTASS